MARLRGSVGPGTLLALLLVYLAAGKLGLSLASVHASASPVWPPTGIALAAALILGTGVWPALLLGAFLVNVTTAGDASTSLGIAVGNTLEALVGAGVVARYAGGCRAFEHPRDVFRFVALAGLLGTALSATVGVTSLSLRGYAAWADYGRIWLTWWLGDVGGALVVAPALLLWLTNPRPAWRRAQAVEALALFAAVVLVAAVVFGGVLAPGPSSPLKYLCLPLSMWAAFRFGPRETATVALLVAALATWVALGGASGPSLNEDLLLLQVFTAVLGVTSLALAALVSERRSALAALELQAAELTGSNAELDRFAHVVSHDLRAPLRAISSLASWVLEDCRQILPEASREHLRLLDERARRMSELIRGVLAYSRAAPAPPPPKAVDPRTVIEEVVDSLGPPPHLSVRIEEPLPWVECDRTQLVQVFQNLIGNAAQHLGRPRGEVVVSCRERDHEVEFTVRDDGVGIAAPELERSLGPGTTAVRGRSPRNGIAIVRRLVEKHGGSFSLESIPDAGTTVRFSIPKPRRAAEPGGVRCLGRLPASACVRGS
jgi:signal transduction histidine kinase